MGRMAMMLVNAGFTTAAAKPAISTISLCLIAEQPIEYLQTLVRKLYLFFSGPEIKRNMTSISNDNVLTSQLLAVGLLLFPI